jgi:hypothetical protein
MLATYHFNPRASLALADELQLKNQPYALLSIARLARLGDDTKTARTALISALAPLNKIKSRTAQFYLLTSIAREQTALNEPMAPFTQSQALKAANLDNGNLDLLNKVWSFDWTTMSHHAEMEARAAQHKETNNEIDEWVSFSRYDVNGDSAHSLFTNLPGFLISVTQKNEDAEAPPPAANSVMAIITGANDTVDMIGKIREKSFNMAAKK